MGRPLILHVATDTGIGGTEARVATFLEHRSRDVADHFFVSIKPLGKIASRISASGVEVVSLEVEAMADLPQAARRLREIIGDLAPRVVQSYLFHANALARPLARLAGVPLVVSGYASTDPRMSPQRRFVDLATARLAHLHLANCRAVAEAARRRTRVRRSSLRVVYPGRPDPLERWHGPTLTELRARRDPPLVLSVGRLHEAKGQTYLLEALQGVRVPWEAAVVGEGPLREALESRAAELGVADRVAFVGEVEDPSPYFAEASVFVLPSLWEGMPGALVEAMFWELPIVATAVGGVIEAVRHRHSALLASPGDPDTLSHLIENLLEDRETATELGVAARKDALARFGVEDMVRSWEAVYLEALAS